MTSELDNLPEEGGTDNTTPPTALDHPDNLNFAEPDDELDTPQVEEDGTETDSETDEADEGQESGEAEAATEETETEGEEAEKADAAEVSDDILIPVNGETLPLKEIKAGYMRQADYSRKTQEVSNSRRDLEAMTARVTKSVGAIAQFLATQIPEAPDPSLAMTDPGRYVREQAMHEAASKQINSVLTMAGETQDVANKLTAEQHRQLVDAENAKLAEAFPQTASQEGRQQFFERAAGAAKELGYSEDEIGGVVDHRMFKLAYYARLGMEAEQAKAKAAQKVVKVPPVTPNKRPQSAAMNKVRQNQDAMKKLSKTGSIYDALKVDFT